MYSCNTSCWGNTPQLSAVFPLSKEFILRLYLPRFCFLFITRFSVCLCVSVRSSVRPSVRLYVYTKSLKIFLKLMLTNTMRQSYQKNYSVESRKLTASAIGSIFDFIISSHGISHSNECSKLLTENWKSLSLKIEFLHRVCTLLMSYWNLSVSINFFQKREIAENKF